ncbi:Uu.00g091350.m01.CDS01 [Anthostomella pinea]|uniref:RING-type E3 ubiquitin transferase n=1 Tax=Anthostomella pinea TaxID=933095 RepID=A0AAI8YHY9_9PEZI|nr:Uu.00g091350.m01.CDS01 [Anthostomella pinea]
MRLLWYAGTSTALAASVVAYAFNQRANFYSAMVYLSQNNLSLMILINLILLVYSSFVWGLQRLCYGPLRPVEIEQLYEKAWFAVTETCLAMTIFREEVGAWFLVMFTALVTGKVWEWIGEGRVEVLEQQPPVNPRLFHTRLSISLLLSVVYDTWLLIYAVKAVIQQARPNMMVMFLFEFAILGTCSVRTALRYALSLWEARIVKKQTQYRLEERRKEVREQRAEIMRRRESGDTTEAGAAEQEELPNEEDIDEMDIEVPGWESKGHWVLSLDLATDFFKLVIYSAFFGILMMFYGLPIHIMRDLFMTARSFVKRLGALMRYRKALQDMNKYPDATQEDLDREDTCIICREDMRPWDPSAVGAVERSRPKKLPCGHILHFGCLKGWLERQQVCPTCRRSVVIDGAAPNGDAAVPGGVAGGQPRVPGQAAPANRGANAGQPAQGRGNMRVFQLGPIRLGFAQGNAQNIQEMAERLRLPLNGANAPPAAAAPAPGPQAVEPALAALGGIHDMQVQLQQISHRLQQEMHRIQQELYTAQASQAEMQTLYALTSELNRLRQIQQQDQAGAPMNHPGQPSVNVQFVPQAQQNPFQPMPQMPQMPQMPPFPGFSPRVSPPTVTRHGGVSQTAAIPAGSQDLPEGVVIPPGWSLLPLQRLDGPPSQQPSGVQPTRTVQPTDAQGQQQQSTVPTNGGAVGDHDATASSSNIAGGHLDNQNGEAPGGHSDIPSSTSSHVQRDQPEVAAPTPIMPNWGGAAQLFANGEAGGPSSTTPSTNEPETSADKASTREAPRAESAARGEDESSSSTAKGKAKAVTIEDADDAEDD